AGVFFFRLLLRFCSWLRSRFRRSSSLQGQDHLADFGLLSLLYQYFFYGPGNRGRNFYHGFIGFQLNYRLALADDIAWLYGNLDDIALLDVLAQLWQLELERSSLPPALWCGGRRSCRFRLGCLLLRSFLLRRFLFRCLRFGGRLLFFRDSVRAISFHGENGLPNFQLLARLHGNIFYRAGNTRGHFDDGLVGFEFDDRLPLRDVVARLHHHSDQVPLLDILSKFR